MSQIWTTVTTKIMFIMAELLLPCPHVHVLPLGVQSPAAAKYNLSLQMLSVAR